MDTDFLSKYSITYSFLTKIIYHLLLFIVIDHVTHIIE